MNTPDITVTLDNGKVLKVYRTEKKDVVIDSDGHQIKLPKASGRLTLNILELINSGGAITGIE